MWVVVVLVVVFAVAPFAFIEMAARKAERAHRYEMALLRATARAEQATSYADFQRELRKRVPTMDLFGPVEEEVSDEDITLAIERTKKWLQ